MTQNNILIDKAIDFAIRMTKCYRYLMEEKGEYIMSKQMFRSGMKVYRLKVRQILLAN